MADTAGMAAAASRGRTTRKPRVLLTSIILVLVAVLVAGCSQGFQSGPVTAATASSRVAGPIPVNGVVQSSTAGAVTIQVEWLGVAEGALKFNIVMDTHSVNLDGYDLGKLALVRDDSGGEYLPVTWRSQPGGHHRSGTLEVSLPPSVEKGQARFVQLVIKNISGVAESILQWNLG